MADHYFSASPAVPLRTGRVALRLADMEMELTTGSGVFSAGRVDPGTVALLRGSGPPPERGDVLDLGCGYGPIACALARRAPGATVWAVDVNRRALELTAANAADLGLPNVRVATPEEVPPELAFAGLWSNPPVRVGKEALHEMLAQWTRRLEAGAAAWLVVNRHLGGDSLAAWLSAEGWTVHRVASKSGYRVLRATAGAPGAAR
jgi:16S rRNA G1207 methylase RsmC